MRAVVAIGNGGPEVLTVGDVDEPLVVPDGCARLRVRTAGLNLADTGETADELFRPAPAPRIPGAEVVGLTEDGRRVLALLPDGGGFAEQVIAREDLLVDVPDGVDDGEAIALLRQGAIAWHAIHICARLRAGESVVVQAAGGGIGLVALQLARLAGASPVVAVASTEQKRALAGELGADAVVWSREPDIVPRLREATGGGADAALHLACRRLFAESFAALGTGGRLVAYGTAAGPPLPPISPRELVARGCAVIGFSLHHCLSDPPTLRRTVVELLRLAATGAVRPVVEATFPLTRAREAHEHLRSRPSGGKVLLTVDAG